MIDAQDRLRIAQLAGCTENHRIVTTPLPEAHAYLFRHEVNSEGQRNSATFPVSADFIEDYVGSWHQVVAHRIRQWHLDDFHMNPANRPARVSDQGRDP